MADRERDHSCKREFGPGVRPDLKIGAIVDSDQLRRMTPIGGPCWRLLSGAVPARAKAGSRCAFVRNGRLKLLRGSLARGETGDSTNDAGSR